MRKFKLGLLAALLAPLSLYADPAWQTAASAEYSLLWKELTYTELRILPQQRPDNGDILDPQYAKQIEIRYGVGVSAERFGEMTRETLAEAYTAAELSPYQSDIDRFCDWFEAVKKGDRYRLSWQPEVGLALSLNGRELGTVQDPDAAAIILSVWLGRAAISESQRDEMLTQWRETLAEK